MVGSDLQHRLVAEAALAPSVHNVQPARWRFDPDAVILFEDTRRRLPAGDPEGRDTAVSLGAATEGLAIALSRHGLALREVEEPGLPPPIASVRPLRRFALHAGAQPDPLATAVAQRYSFRGAFAPPTEDDRSAARKLAGDGVVVLSGVAQRSRIGRLYDQAGLHFFRDPAFRAELLSWMRLSRRHPNWAADGLNAQAMAMTGLEAAGAGVALGRRAFPLLDRLGLGGPLTSEAARLSNAAAILVLHRPVDEDPFATGRAFYRLWLRVAAAGLQGAVMASLADHPVISAELARDLKLPPDRRITSALRIGRPPGGATYPRARLPVTDLLV